MIARAFWSAVRPSDREIAGFAVLSSDAFSSVAYATDFIVATLIVAGTAALGYAIPISVVTMSPL